MPTSKTRLHLELWHLFIVIVRHLSRPAPIYDSLPRDAYRKVQALNISLVLASVALILATFTSFIISNKFVAYERLVLFIGNPIIFIIAYVIVQRGMWQTVARMLFPSQMLMIFAYAVHIGDRGMNVLYYMVFVMLWAGHFLRWREWLLLITFHISLVILHSWLIAGISLDELYRKVGLFTLVSVGIAMLVRAYQDRSYTRFVAELAHAEANLRTIMQASSNGYYLLDAVTDDEGAVIDFKIIEVNDAACKELNMTREQLIGGQICDLFPINKTGGFFEQYKQVYLTGVPLEQEYHIPANMVGAGWYYHRVVKRENGLVIINRDITERKQTELDLVKRQNRLQSLIQSQSAYLIRTDLKGRYTFANQRFLEKLGYTEAELIGTDSMPSIYSEDHAKTAEVVTRCLQQPNTPIPVTLRKVGKDGRMWWTDWEFTAITNHMGEIIEIQCVGMDATNRIRAQQAQLEAEQLRIELRHQAELNETKMRMMTRISHEFRTPLSIIRSSADLLTHYVDKLSAEKRVEKIKNINEGIDRLNHMLNDMELILHGRDQPHLIKQMCDLHILLREVITRYQAIEDNRRAYVVTIQDDFPPVLADKDQIELLFTNLISNAIKFSPISKPVMIELSYTDSEWIFIVRDEGIGILLSEQDKIFDPFFRGTNFGEIGGLGLGLSVVKRIVNAHNGLILVDSTPNVGTSMTVKIPREL